MYNGIGLHTPRGSGTSGYVEKTKIKKEKQEEQRQPQQPKVRGISPALQKYDEMREIELQCYIYRKKLMEENEKMEIIEEKVQKLRLELQKK